MKLNPGLTIKVDYMKVLYPTEAIHRPITKIFDNTLLFADVWRYVKRQATWTSFSWVVKVNTATAYVPA